MTFDPMKEGDIKATLQSMAERQAINPEWLNAQANLMQASCLYHIMEYMAGITEQLALLTDVMDNIRIDRNPD